MYKLSCHNTIFQDQEKILIFNRRTRKYIKAIKAKNEVVDIIYNKNISNMNSRILKKLIDTGILVDSQCDELGDLKLIENDLLIIQD